LLWWYLAKLTKGGTSQVPPVFILISPDNSDLVILRFGVLRMSVIAIQHFMTSPGHARAVMRAPARGFGDLAIFHCKDIPAPAKGFGGLGALEISS
jgi:hypothetical protein